MKRSLHMAYRGLLLAAAALLASCERPPTLPPDQEGSAIDTSYVEIAPSWGGYAGAEDIQIGLDQLLYIADTRANRILMLNRAGQILSARPMLRPRSVAQDTRLDLLVGGEMVTPAGDTAGAIFRLTLVSASPDSAHRLDLAPCETLWVELSRPARRFPGIATFGDNEYLVVRTGPDNSSFVDPDARVLLFNARDEFVTPLPFRTRVGRGITDIDRPTAIASIAGSKDFILVQSSVNVAYGSIWMRYERTVDFDGWLPRFDPARPEDQGVDFVRADRYLQPEAVAVDRARRDIFVADAELDSVFKFTGRGRFRSESFGRVRTGGRMLRPTGLAYFERILYVLDGERGEVLRFRLSTDVPR